MKPAGNQDAIRKEFEAISKRDFVARRGRNGQILLQLLPKTIFHDQEIETEKHPTSGIVGIDA